MPDLLMTKLFIPRRRHNSVPRPRLIDELKVGVDRKLTLISAPAGFGKTTLLSEWIPQSDRCVTWVSLDEGDNDPARFWAYFIAALQMLNPNIGKDALALLQSPQPPLIEAVLTILLNEIADFPDSFAHVLDDYQVIHSQPVHTALLFFLEHMPPNMHLIIASRTDPPFPLGRLRSRGLLNEFRSIDLRFTQDETAVFMNQVMGLNLSTENIISLETHTEGWIAGLQLAGLALQARPPQPDGRDSASAFIQAFTGSHRYIVSYLVEEVLSQQSKETIDFLLQTSILDRLSAPLCDSILLEPGDRHPNAGGSDLETLSPIPDSQSMLDQLEHANLFVVPLDDEGKWYRYHHLFADVLRARLQKSQPGRIRELHLRASEWCERSGSIPEAVRHASEAEDWEHAARLIEQNAIFFGSRGQIHLVLSWLTPLPESVMHAHPLLCTFHAGTLMHHGRLVEAAARLQDAEASIQAGTPADKARLIMGRVSMIRANLVRIQGDIGSCVELSRQALDLLPESEIIPRASAGLNLVYGFLISGDVQMDNEHLVTLALESVRASGNVYLTLRATNLLARLSALQGRLHRCEEIYVQASTTFSGQHGPAPLTGISDYFFGLGDLKREWNQLDESERILTQGVVQAQRYISDGDEMMQGYQSLARLKQARGDTQGAIATLDEYIRLAQQHHFSDQLLASVGAVRAWLDLLEGNISAAAQWAETSRIQTGDELSFPREREFLTLARLNIWLGRNHPENDHLQKALQLLDRLRAAAQADGRMGSLIEILCLQALAFQATGDLDQARKAIEHAITHAGPEDYIRTFVDEGKPMRELLLVNRLSVEGKTAEYVGRLLASFQSVQTDQHLALNLQPSSLSEPLSNRELGVLRLIAEGASNKEISIRLVIAPPTVKRHISNIFCKLGVPNRTKAVAAGRKIGLL